MSEIRHCYNEEIPVWASTFLFKSQPVERITDISRLVAMRERHRMELISATIQQNNFLNFPYLSFECAKLASRSEPILTTMKPQLQWNGYRDSKKSYSDSTDNESELGKDIISPECCGSSPDSDFESTLRRSSLPDIARTSRTLFTFEPQTNMAPITSKPKLVRERSRSDSEAMSDKARHGHTNHHMAAPPLFKKRILKRYNAELVSNKRRKTPPDPMCPGGESYANYYRPASAVNIRRVELPVLRALANPTENFACNNATTNYLPSIHHEKTLVTRRRSRSETDAKKLVCQYCGQLFDSQAKLSKHVTTMHRLQAPTGNTDQISTKCHTCLICHKSFGRSDMLTRHIRLHTGVKPYSCTVCFQMFSRSDHLSTHQRTHTGEKPYQCPQCSYSASRRDMITRHLRTHNKPKFDLPLINCKSDKDNKSYVSVIQRVGNAEEKKLSVTNSIIAI